MIPVFFTITPFMFLTLPDPSLELGPEWAIELVTAYGVIDSHTHVLGQGVLIPTAGLSIDLPLVFNSVNPLGVSATGLRSTQYLDQSALLTGPTDLTSLYFFGGNLFAQDGVGNNIRVTLNGALDTSAFGFISGLVAPAAVTYSAPKFTFTQSAGVPAIISAATYNLSPAASNAFNIAITAPGTISASYTLTLPAAVPAVTSLLSEDNAGNVSYSVTDGVTLQDIANVLSVKTVPHNLITGLNSVVSPSTGTYVSTGSPTVAATAPTLTTQGKPVTILILPATASVSTPGNVGYRTPDGNGVISIARDGTPLALYFIGATGGANPALMDIPPGGVSFVDFPSAGSYVYTLRGQTFGSGVTRINNCVLFAYEM